MLLHSYYPEDGRVAAEVRAAIASGFEVAVLALRGQNQEPQEWIDGARVIRLPVGHRRGSGKLALLGEYLSFTARAIMRAAACSVRRRFDVVHVNNPPDFLVLATLVPRLLGAKVVFDVHDLSADLFMMRFHNAAGGFVDRVLTFVERLAALASDAVVTVHEPYRQELARHGIPVGKVSVVLNSLDEALIPTDAAPPAAAEGFRVVYHGTITPHYGVELLVEAAARARSSIPGLRLELYGAGDALPGVMERAHSLGLDDVLHVAPRLLSRREVLQAVQFASAGVIPNLPLRLNRFALPTKLFEYVALGIPAVVADLETIRAHFSEGEVWFFEPGNPLSLAAALERVAADPQAVAGRVAAARARYETYRWDRYADVYTELLWRLAARRRRRVAVQRPATRVRTGEGG
jgi:glycosyltransferase involved in cell wall biosynthesis